MYILKSNEVIFFPAEKNYFPPISFLLNIPVSSFKFFSINSGNKFYIALLIKMLKEIK